MGGGDTHQSTVMSPGQCVASTYQNLGNVLGYP
jgi:hypothetical protein